MKLIESKTLGTAAASIDFTSIPQTYTDLVIFTSVRTAAAITNERLTLRFNADSGNNYSNRQLSGNGSTAASSVRTSQNIFSLEAGITGANATANTFASGFIHIPNYTSNLTKLIWSESVTETNATEAWQAMTGHLWNNTAAVSSFSVSYFNGTANLVAGSMVSLYGITKGSDGIVTTS
jgi:hypothetical protein